MVLTFRTMLYGLVAYSSTICKFHSPSPNLPDVRVLVPQGYKLHDPYSFHSFKIFTSRLTQAFELPRAEFRARDELLKLIHGKQDVLAYAQKILYLSSCLSAKRIDEHPKITFFIQSLIDGLVTTHLFRLRYKSMDQAISVAEQVAVSIRQTQISSSIYRPTRRQETLGPKLMDLCYVERVNPLSRVQMIAEMKSLSKDRILRL